jgi:hypothetical protein
MNLPHYIDPEAWADYKEMRDKKKKPLTRLGTVRALNTLERLWQEGQDITLVLNQSADRGFTGLFPVSLSYYQERGIQVNQNSVINNLDDRSWAT